jgi:hypothetical protein
MQSCCLVLRAWRCTSHCYILLRPMLRVAVQNEAAFGGLTPSAIGHLPGAAGEIALNSAGAASTKLSAHLALQAGLVLSCA